MIANSTMDFYHATLYSLGATAVISIAPVLLLMLIPFLTKPSGKLSPFMLKILVSFAVGGLLGDAFLHLIPHAMEEAAHSSKVFPHNESAHEHDNSVGLLVLGGMLTFFIMELVASALLKSGGSGHGHSHGPGNKKSDKDFGNNDHKTGGYLNIFADCSHNFTDGLAIAASFLVSPAIGMSTTLAVLVHEVPHEIGDYAILVQSGFTTSQAMKVQLLTASGAFAGTIVGLVSVGSTMTGAILPVTAGGFIYVALVDVVPTLLQEKVDLGQAALQCAAMCVGLALMASIDD